MSLTSLAANLAVHGRLGEHPGPFDPGQVRRILVVRNDNIGDVVCTTPALDALRSAFPRAHLAAAVCTLAEEVVQGHRALDEVLAYPKAKHRRYGPVESHRRLAAMLRRLRRRRFDLVVCLRSAFSTSQAWIAFASGGRWRLGPRAEGSKQRLGFFYNLPVSPPEKGLHEVERCFHLLRHIRVDSADKRLYLKVPAAAKEKAAAFWEAHGLAGEPAPVVLNLTRWSYRPDRAWPDGRYRALAEALAARPGGVVATTAPADAQWARGLLEGLEPRPPLFWSPSLKEFCAVAARGRAMITAEGGPMHLAAAVGAPLVVLWSNTSPAEWRPWGVASRLLGRGGPLSRVEPGEVLAAVEELAGSGASRPEWE
jgi:ADP-heptose:LPS heptosyltransferase